MIERQHHPSCSARFGGLCTTCPAQSKQPADHEPDITCPCGETFVLTGDTQLARDRAIRDWAGCCDTDTPRSEGPDAPTEHGATTPAESLSGEGSDLAGPGLVARMFPGVPAWVRRRVATWPIDPTDLRV